MLVVSRRAGEKIIFPCFNAAVRVVSIKANTVRLGVEAPPDVAVFREEVLPRLEADGPAVSPPNPTTSEMRHRLRNRLNAAAVGLALLQRQVGLSEDAGATLTRVSEELQALRGCLESLTEPPTRPSGPPTMTRRALLVEDDPNERELLAGFLRVAGLEVATARDGAEALDYLQTHEQPDAILLDMVLPRCDGPTTVRMLRNSPAYAGLKIFGVSGHPPEYFGLICGPAGIDRWFPKPLDPEQLLVELHRELGVAA